MKRRNKKKNEWSIYSWSAVCCLALLLINACYEPVEACLDAQAVNFDVNADRDCSDCCQYPKLKLSIKHLAGEQFISFDSVYLSGNGQAFRIRDFDFYLSQLKLVMADGRRVGVRDEVEALVLINGNIEAVELEDNYQLVNRQKTSATVGEFRESGELAGVEFLIGVDQVANRADPLSFPNDHPLRPQPDTMHWNQEAGYIFNKVDFQPDTSAVEEITMAIGSIPNLVQVELAYAKTLKKGFDLTIPLEIDYLNWFKGIDFEAGTAEIRQQIVDQTPAAFSIAQ